jgi:DNA-binding MarR family transcriptional regulator
MTTSQKALDAPVPTSKIDQVLALLGSEHGATLTEITELTDWLPHTARAALTGLRKKGHAITRDKRGEVTCYHIAGQA